MPARKTTAKTAAKRKRTEGGIILPDIREGVLHDKNGKPVAIEGAPVDSAPETPAADETPAED